MGKLLYLVLASLDGYVEDDKGRFEWAEPSEEVHAFVNDISRGAGTHLYGRRMYETMAPWETDPTFGSQPGVGSDFAAIWQAADKIVYSTTLPEPAPTRRTAVERTFDPDAVRALKASSEQDLMIGGASLAAAAFAAGLIDELHLFLTPIIVGGGKAALPDGVHADLELAGDRRFANGTAYLHYLVR
jgi:dihydrofolate reductase